MTNVHAPSMSPYMGERLDRAWLRGFEAGRQEWRKVIPVAIAGGAIALMCRRGVPVIVKVAVFYALLFAALVALVLSPLIILLLITRATVQWRKDHRPVAAELADPDAF